MPVAPSFQSYKRITEEPFIKMVNIMLLQSIQILRIIEMFATIAMQNMQKPMVRRLLIPIKAMMV